MTEALALRAYHLLQEAATLAGRDVMWCAVRASCPDTSGCWAWGGVCSEASATMRIPCCEWVQSSERQAGKGAYVSGSQGTLAPCSLSRRV